jgi:hypothetical protein
MRALLAAVQRLAALGAIPLKIGIGRQSHGAVVAARGSDALDQPGELWSGDIEGRPGAWRLTAIGARKIGPPGILVSALSVFTIVVHDD